MLIDHAISMENPWSSECIGAEGWSRMWTSLSQGSEKLLVATWPFGLPRLLGDACLTRFLQVKDHSSDGKDFCVSFWHEPQFEPCGWVKRCCSIKQVPGDACMHNNLGPRQQTWRHCITQLKVNIRCNCRSVTLQNQVPFLAWICCVQSYLRIEYHMCWGVTDYTAEQRGDREQSWLSSSHIIR